MSLKLNSSGGGSVTLQEPVTANNQTLTLPDNSGTLVSTASQPSFASTIAVGGATPAVSGAGITFPATLSASSDANTLDDYEEGSWTPVLWGSSSSPTYTPGGTAARYVKIGRMVYFNLSLQWSSAAGGGGTLGVSLPFAVANISNYWTGSASVGYCSGLAFSVSGTYTDPGQNNMFFRKFDTVGTLLQVSNISSSGHIMMGGCYLVD